MCLSPFYFYPSSICFSQLCHSSFCFNKLLPSHFYASLGFSLPSIPYAACFSLYAPPLWLSCPYSAPRAPSCPILLLVPCLSILPHPVPFMALLSPFSAPCAPIMPFMPCPLNFHASHIPICFSLKPHPITSPPSTYVPLRPSYSCSQLPRYFLSHLVSPRLKGLSKQLPPPLP